MDIDRCIRQHLLEAEDDHAADVDRSTSFELDLMIANQRKSSHKYPKPHFEILARPPVLICLAVNSSRSAPCAIRRVDPFCKFLVGSRYDVHHLSGNTCAIPLGDLLHVNVCGAIAGTELCSRHIPDLLWTCSKVSGAANPFIIVLRTLRLLLCMRDIVWNI